MRALVHTAPSTTVVTAHDGDGERVAVVIQLLHDQVMLLTSVIQLLPNIIFCLPFRSVELGYGAVLLFVVTWAYM